MAVMTVGYGQNTYVSKPIADAINGGKFYMKLYGLQTDDDEEDDDEESNIPSSGMVTMEMAQSGKVVLSSATMGRMAITHLFANGKRYMLDMNSRLTRLSQIQEV